MPTTIPDLIYVFMTALVLLGMGVIGVILKKGFDLLISKMSGVAAEISGLRVEIKDEREDRITAYGVLMGKYESHKAVCDERHGRRDNRVIANEGSE